MFDYHGRVAVITGGSSGLGVLCANALAARGCDVVLAASRFEILEKNAQALREQYGVKAIPVRCDVTRIRLLLHANSWRKNLVAVTS